MDHFSKKEQRYLEDTEFLITKHTIIEKVKTLLGHIEQSLHKEINKHPLPAEVIQRSGKISKGENYQGLPYLILDYPRKFNEGDIFAFRTMFWWGNFFSSTFHLGGQHWADHQETVIQHCSLLSGEDWYICVNQSPWEYHYGDENYLWFDSLEKKQQLDLLQNHPFLKLSKKWDLKDQHLFSAEAPKAFAKAMEMIEQIS